MLYVLTLFFVPSELALICECNPSGNLAHFSDFYVRTVLLKAGIGHSLELSNTIHRQVFELVPISYVIQCEAPLVRHALAPAAWISTAFDLPSSFYEVENLI